MTPSACIAAMTFAVPPVLMRSRSLPPLQSRAMATRWTTASVPRTAAPSEDGSVTSPLANETLACWLGVRRARTVAVASSVRTSART